MIPSREEALIRNNLPLSPKRLQTREVFPPGGDVNVGDADPLGATDDKMCEEEEDDDGCCEVGDEEGVGVG